MQSENVSAYILTVQVGCLSHEGIFEDVSFLLSGYCQTSVARKWSSSRRDHIIYNQTHSYKVIEFCNVFGEFDELFISRPCKQNISLKDGGHHGWCLGFEIIVKCTCGHREINWGPFINTDYEIKWIIVFVIRPLVSCREGINISCDIMDINKGISI